MDYLNANYNKNISLVCLAEVARLSPFHFLREFSKEMEISPHVYQVQVRLAHARKLLVQGVHSSQVALDTGFFDQSHMIRQFKKYVGVTPAQYAVNK